MKTVNATTDVNFTVTRVVAFSEKTFAEVTSAIEAMATPADNQLLRQLKRLDTNKSFEQVQVAVESMLGKSGLTVLVDFELGGLLTSQSGVRNKSKLYIIGNPLIANQMFEVDPAVGLYVPLRLFVYEDVDGRTCVTYDQPSSLLGQLQNAEILEVAQMLDGKLADLVAIAI
ncbi:DUF302 domain-containing protein [Nostoc sp. TCL26-01]|uniref:DUF302 domain-containing protein n=1 Tax=Nostoc sp. TCL26-01 TaxID=2576904 RepID=UPI0015B7D184|nr:DUF302 domain-containing protein [Nostoc sp. TCL26-01]QLE58179.1 DUF302 domain-containing protein [Nostoc sp. TCL26-01]